MQKSNKQISGGFSVPSRLSLIMTAALLSTSMATSAANAQVATAAPAPNPFAQELLGSGESFRINRIAISGNQRIERSTILSYIGIREGLPFNRYDVDRGLKALFATGFFADVKMQPIMERAGGAVLQVQVTENPIINQVAFEGNRRIPDEDLRKEIDISARTIFTRPRVESATQRLLQIYKRSGRYQAKIEPKVIALENNRINLVFEIAEGKETRVTNIDFVGNKLFPDSTLEDVIQTSEERWWSPFSSDEKYDPDRVAYDKELLRRYYVSQGYADFQVKSAIAEITPNGEDFYLTYTVDEGERYTFGNVTIDDSLSQVDLSTNVTTVSGETYNADEIENTIENIVKKLGDKGFAFVDIKPNFTRNYGDRTIDLTYNINMGPRVYVERINIDGNSRTLDEVIRREFRVAEGDAYSTTKLARSEQRVKNLGFFENVAVSQQPGSAPDQTVVNVQVQEQSTGEISLGAGFSSTDGALAEFGIRESNLLGRGQELRLNALLAAERQQFDIGFTEPYFLDRELSAGFDLFKTRTDFSRESSFDRESLGGALRLGYALTEHARHQGYYRYEDIEITDVDDDASRFIKDQEGSNVSSLIGHSLTWDTRNNRFDTTEGHFLKISQDFAGLGGDSRFLRHEFKGATFIPLAPQWTLSFGGTAGHIFSWDDERDVRINERFFIGNRQLRGFDRSGIGPRDITTTDALGGNTFYTATAELMFPLGLPDDLGFLGAAFVDVGDLWDLDATGPEVRDAHTPRVSAGLGLAWRSPFGPIRIDFAKAILKEDEDETQIFNFSFGTRF